MDTNPGGMILCPATVWRNDRCLFLSPAVYGNLSLRCNHDRCSNRVGSKRLASPKVRGGRLQRRRFLDDEASGSDDDLSIPFSQTSIQDGSDAGSDAGSNTGSGAESGAESEAGSEAGSSSAGKWNHDRKLMVQAWPLAWLVRIGSTKRLPFWTFLQTLVQWFETRGKATGALQRGRGLRQYSHHSAIDNFLEVRGERRMQHLAAGPPEVVPGFAHCLTWIDNYLQYLNMTEERKQRTGAGEKHATVIGYAVPRAEAARVPAWPACIPQWNALPVGTVLSWTKPCFICREPNSIWSGVTVSELRAGAHLCNRFGRCLSADALKLDWYEALGDELTESELA